MTVCTANFETGTNGNAVATGDAGSVTAWNVVNAGGTTPLPYDNTHVAHGLLAAKLFSASSPNTYMAWTTPFGTETDHYGRIYLYLTAVPGTNKWVGLAHPFSSTSACAHLYINPTGHIEIRDSANAVKATSTNVVALNQFIRVEWHYIHSTTVGQVEVKYFATADSATVTETITTTANLNTLASADSIRIGQEVAGLGIMSTAVWLDNIVANATAYPGPFPVNSVAPGVTGLTPVGSTLTCDGGTWNGTFTLTYQWTRDGASIVGETANTYVTQAADVGHAIGCTVTATGVQATNEAASQASSNTVTPTAAVSSLPSSGIRSHGRGRDRF